MDEIEWRVDDIRTLLEKQASSRELAEQLWNFISSPGVWSSLYELIASWQKADYQNGYEDGRADGEEYAREKPEYPSWRESL